MKSNTRWVVATIFLLTAVAVAMLWGLHERSQGALREQVIERAARRSVQLADAMAGQVEAELALMDHTLMDARATWLEDPEAFQRLGKHRLENLPDGLVSYLGLVNAEGRVVYNSLGVGIGLDISDRPYFKAMRVGADSMVIGSPVKVLFDGAWVIPVGRPLYRGGRFAGAVFLLVSAERMAQNLARLELAKDDVVVLLKPDGDVLARSVDNASGMGKVVAKTRPYMQDMAALSGSYWEHGAVDKVSRVFGWHRLPVSRLVMVVGLAESTVLAPLVPSMNRSRWLTTAFSALLLLGGLMVAWLIWSEGRSGQAMRESERLLKEAQRTAKVGHMSANLRRGSMVWSDEMFRIFGYERDDPAVGELTVDCIYARVHPEDLPSLKADMYASVQGCQSVELSHRIVMPSGQVKHLRVQSVVEGENGEAVRISAAVQDVTEVKVAQLALKDVNEKLEARVETRTRELASLNNELEAFTYSVSHDLRTPLRSIHGFATLLADEDEQLSPEGRTYLRRVLEGARRMGMLITDLLTMAHQSRVQVNLQYLSLSELAQAVVVDVEREDPLRRVAWHIDPGLCAWADPVLMRAVLQNLLGNAWKYSRQVAQAEISFQCVGQAGGMTEYCVRDNGAGFDMAYVDQLFEPFKRLHAHHEFEGSGVGLASVQRLVQRHGGTVRAEGAVGKGAAVYFALPDDPESAQDHGR